MPRSTTESYPMSRHYIMKITREKGPMSAKQLAAELGINESSTRSCIRRARTHGTRYLRIAAWAGNVALYGPGPAEDAECTDTVAQIVDYLEGQRTGTNAQIAKHTGLSVTAVDSATRRMHKSTKAHDPRRLYIAGWQRRIGKLGGRMSAIFAIGNRKDEPKPDNSCVQKEAEKRYAEKRRIKTALRTGQRLRGPKTRATPTHEVRV